MFILEQPNHLLVYLYFIIVFRFLNQNITEKVHFSGIRIRIVGGNGQKLPVPPTTYQAA